MKRLALLALVACSHGDPAPKPSEPLPMSVPALPTILGDATDLVTVVADGWDSTTVTVARWKRASFISGWDAKRREFPPWDSAGESWTGVIGHAGLAWGDGLHGNGAPDGHDGPVKREGDGKSPAGAFRIINTFGYKLYRFRNFIHLTETTECVDDPKSTAYDTIVEHTGSADWTSSEHMRRADDLYSIGAVVDHNPKHTPGGGSCIFLHVWGGPDSTTVGCTAMDKDKLAHLLAGFDERPVLVQLPRAEYRALQHEWGLPPQ